MRLMKKEEFDGYEFKVIETVEDEQLKYYYSLNKGEQNLAYVVGRVDKITHVFSIELLISAKGMSKTQTVKAFKILIPRTEEELVKRGITEYRARTNARMARQLEKKQGEKKIQAGKRFEIKKRRKRR